MRIRTLKTIRTIALLACVGACALGVRAWDISSATADSVAAEWITGNGSVTAMFNYDITNSVYGEGGDNPGYWRIRAYDSNTMTSNNSALSAENFWYKTNYVNLKPLFYETVANAENPSINLGVYGEDFGISTTPVQSTVANAMMGVDYMGLVYTFTDIDSGEYFQIKTAAPNTNTTNAQISISVNGGMYEGATGMQGSFVGRFGGTKGSANAGIFFIQHIKYDQDENAIKYNNNLGGKLSLADYGIKEAFDKYTVDLSFVNIAADKTAKLCVYHLNGLDLCGKTKDTLGEYHNTVVLQKQMEKIVETGGKVTLSELFFAWDAIRGDVTDQIAYAVKDPSGSSVTVTDGKIVLNGTGTYEITCTVGTAEFTTTAFLGDHNVHILQLADKFLKGSAVDYAQLVSVQDTKDGDIFDEANITLYAPDGNMFTGKAFTQVGDYKIVCAVENYKGITMNVEYTIRVSNLSQEWESGNDDVNVTMNYDITNSVYGEKGENPGYWRIRAYDSNSIVSKNSALSAENFWYKTNYVNLKPMFYETVANAENPSINLGYYASDFKMAVTPVQSTQANVYNSAKNLDYYGLVYTFTDTVTENYFQVRIYNATNIEKQAKIDISVNGGEFGTAQTYHGSFGGRFNGTAGSANSGTFFVMNLKYDQEENALKYNSGLGDKFDLTALGLHAFNTYKVDMAFYQVQPDKTAKLCVYYLNDYDLTKDLDEQAKESQILIEGKIPAEVFQMDTVTLPKATVWDAFDGNVLTPTLVVRAIAPDGTDTQIVDGKLTFTQAGKYTIKYSVTSETKGVETVKAFEVVALGSIPVASFSFGKDMPTRFGVGGTLYLPKAETSFLGESVNSYIVVERAGKVVTSFADASKENKLLLNEKGTYKISYVYTSKYGYSNAQTYVVECVDALTIVDPELPNQISFGTTDFVVANGIAKIGDTLYGATLAITAPSGASVELRDGLFLPEEIGTYTFTYTAEAEGQTALQTYTLNVEYGASTMFTAGSNVEGVFDNVEANYVTNENNNGVAVVMSAAGEVRFKNVVDLSTLGKTPIIEFQPLQKADGYAYITSVIVTLTDVYDEENTVKIKWVRNNDALVYTYLSVNAGGNGYYGLTSDGKSIFKDKYGTNVGCSFYIDQYKPSKLSNICMDYADNEFMADYYNGKYVTIVDADDIDHVGDGYQWGGFTTGEVYITISVPGATDGGVIITSIAGQSLGGTRISDVTPPSFIFKTEKSYVEDAMPEGVVGVAYPIPTVVARDLVSGEMPVAVAVTDGAGAAVEVKDGSFIPTAVGAYTVTWTTKDVVGNEATASVSVQVKDKANDISVEFVTDIGDVYIGDNAYIPAIKTEGGNGKVAYTAEWTFNGEPVAFSAPGFYQATTSGTLVCKVVATDYIGNQKTQELAVEVLVPELPIITVSGVPTSAITGKTIVLPDFMAIDYNFAQSEVGYNATRKIFVDGTEIDLTERKYQITQEAGEVLTVHYEATGKNGKQEKTFLIHVIETQFISDYLIYDKTKVQSTLNESYTEFTSTQDFSVKMPNPVSTQDMAIAFYADDTFLQSGGVVSVLLTDSDDASVQVKVSLKLNAEKKLAIYANDNTDILIPFAQKADGLISFAFNGVLRQISDGQGKKVLGLEYMCNGLEFSGFASGGAKVEFLLTGVTGKTYLRLNQVGNQRLVSTFMNGEPLAFNDRTTGQLTYEYTMESMTVKRGDRVRVSAVKVFDVLQNNATVTVKVQSPTKTLYNGVAIDETFYFATEEYGYYRITYTIKVGTKTETLPAYAIKVKDEVPPTITVLGNVATTVKVGGKIILPNATVSDDGTASDMLQLYVFVVEPSGRYVNVTESLSYTGNKAGEYKVVYYVVDNDYNVARQEFVVQVK